MDTDHALHASFNRNPTGVAEVRLRRNGMRVSGAPDRFELPRGEANGAAFGRKQTKNFNHG